MKGGRSKADSKITDAKLKTRGRKAGKKQKDPNKPKRPPSAFFVFLYKEGFRKQFKEENPNNKSVSVVGKAAGDKWKAMSDADKAPYVEKAEKKKSEYTKNMESYNKKLAGEDDESDKSKSEVNDAGEEQSGEEEDED